MSNDGNLESRRAYEYASLSDSSNCLPEMNWGLVFNCNAMASQSKRSKQSRKLTS